MATKESNMHRARNGWLGVSVAAMAVALLQSASVPSAASQQPPAGGQPAAGQPAGQQGRGGGRGAQPQPRVRKALLAWADTRNGQAQHAFTSHALAIVERLGYESGLWDTFIRTDSHIVFNQAQKTDGTPASGGPSLSNVDGIFFLGHRDVPITDQQKAELLAFVRGGKGFVAAHTGLTAFESWPEFAEMLGAAYGGHLYTGPGRMISEQPSHPIVKHWGATPDYSDEFYRAKGLSRDKVDVLLRFDPASAPGSGLPSDGDFPLIWTKTYGQGRVVYSSLSHSTEAWDIRNVQLTMFEAIKWSLGLTEAPVQPHAVREPVAAR
jgi:type 1 glutamine amidotransferase